MGLPFLEPVSGGRGGGEDEVVKNQAVISISYQVLGHCQAKNFEFSLHLWDQLILLFPLKMKVKVSHI